MVAVRKDLLNHSREIKKAGSCVRLVAVRKDPSARTYFNKEQTPLDDLLDPNPRFHGGCFGVLRHTSSEALKL